MAFAYYNPNPVGLHVRDCTVRALCVVLRIDWDSAHKLLSDTARSMGMMMDDPDVIRAILRRRGFRRDAIPDTCPDCYTIADFARDHKRGVYVVATGTHIVAIVNGDWYDSWNSGDEVPVYFWHKAEKQEGQTK